MVLARTGWGAAAVFLRSGWHWLFGSALGIGFKVLLWFGFWFIPFPWGVGREFVLVVVVYWVSLAVLFQLATNGGAPSRVIMGFRVARVVFGWRLGWRFRSRWPMSWAVSANKTKTVQAEVGTTSEATVMIRPVFDAPKMSWWPRIQWPMISWWVSPPPGRTFEQFEAVLDVLASNMANVEAIQLDYERTSSSVGRLSVLFDDALATPTLPEYHSDDDVFVAESDLVDTSDLRPLGPVRDGNFEVS